MREKEKNNSSPFRGAMSLEFDWAVLFEIFIYALDFPVN